MSTTNGANLGFEQKLWEMADKLRNNMDAAEYKHVVLGLLFLKYISDAFEEEYDRLSRDEWADPEDPDEYLANNIFWVSREARWKYIRDNAKKPEIGRIIDDAMVAIEKDNPSLKNVLPKDYARPDLDKTRLGRSSTFSPSKWETRRVGPRMCWDGSMSIFSAALPAPKAKTVASSTLPARWSSYLWK